MTLIKDIGWLLLVGLLLPLLVAGALAGLVIVVVRQLYWWARGNTTSASRRRRRRRFSWSGVASSPEGWRFPWSREPTPVVALAPETTPAP